MHIVSNILTYVRGYRNSSVKKVRINKQPGRFLIKTHLVLEVYQRTNTGIREYLVWRKLVEGLMILLFIFIKGLNSTCLFLMEVWMTEGPRANFVMREALFEIYTWILCLSYLHEKQTSRIQYLYLYFIKIVPFWLWNIHFLIHNRRYSEQPPEQPAYMSRMFRHGKMDVKIFLMFIVAENTGSVNVFV